MEQEEDEEGEEKLRWCECAHFTQTHMHTENKTYLSFL